MKIDVVTLFPEMFPGYLNESILDRARQSGKIEVYIHNLRDFAEGRHRITDEPPYGGGGGMVLKPGPIFNAVESILDYDQPDGSNPPIILLSPQGRQFSHAFAQELAMEKRIIFICGRYEGVDERVRQKLVTDEISIGDYVLTGGELAALVVMDAVARLLPGVLGAANAADEDSHAGGLLEGPHYTRPENFRDLLVPEVLRSGHAAKIEAWRRQESLRRTWERRPELLLTADLSENDKFFLAKLAVERADARN